MDERVITRRGLVHEHVARRGADLPRGEGDIEIVLVDDAAARSIDEQQVRIRGGKHRRVDEIARLVAERDAHVHEVRTAEELRQRRHLLIAPGGALGGRAPRIPAQDAHVERRAQDVRHAVGDVARADEAERAAGHLVAHKLLRAEVVEAAGTQAVVDKFQLPVERQQIRYGQLRDGRRAEARHIRHGHAVLGGGSGVDRVAADAVHGDDLQVRRARDDRARHDRAADDHGGELLGVVEIVHDLKMAREPGIGRRRDVFTQVDLHDGLLPPEKGPTANAVGPDAVFGFIRGRCRGGGRACGRCRGGCRPCGCPTPA